MARRDKKEEREVARERIRTLLALAEEAIRGGMPERAHRYADLMWRLKTTYQIRGAGMEWRVCRACRAFLAPGSTARVRLAGGKRSITCLRCGVVRRKVLRVPPAAEGTSEADEEGPDARRTDRRRGSATSREEPPGGPTKQTAPPRRPQP